eukprot:7290099-Alexandrium_andersonii.AAC.1
MQQPPPLQQPTQVDQPLPAWAAPCSPLAAALLHAQAQTQVAREVPDTPGASSAGSASAPAEDR